MARGFPAPPRAGNEEGRILQIGQDENVELTGFEPVTPSLRKMWSNTSDQGKRLPLTGLWSGCGTSDVRPRET